MPHSSDLTRAVVRAVADREEVPPADLPPLEENVDSETFDRLTSAESRPPERLEFSYLWYQIQVEAGRIVAIEP